MAFIDVNVALGRFASGNAGFTHVDELQGELARLGIGAALVHHAVAAQADVNAGNSLLLRQIGEHKDLYPCWVMLPEYFNDVPKPKEWARSARDAGVRAVRLLPRYHLFEVREWCIGRLCQALEESSLPMFLDFGPRHWSEALIPWDGIREIALAHPALPIIVIGANVGDVRTLPALLRELPNLYSEIHAFNPPEAMEQFADADLSGQLIFGTGLPKRAAECVVGQLRAAKISSSALQSIAAGNASKLLGLGADGMAGVSGVQRKEFEIIDVHAHIGSWERTTTPLKGPDAFVRSMDRCGVDKMVFSSFTAIHGETRIGNDETDRAVAQQPGRLYGYAVVNPNRPDDSIEDLKRLLATPSGFVGLKLHCQLHGAQLHDTGYAECLAFADAHHLPVLVHGGGQDKWDDVTQRYPHATFIMAHACSWDGRDPVGRALYERVRHTPNLYVDVSGSAAHRNALSALVGLVGAERVLYGSDFPMFDLGFEVGRVTLSAIPDAQKRLILGANARRVFSRLH